jgi:hypothetical protein
MFDLPEKSQKSWGTKLSKILARNGYFATNRRTRLTVTGNLTCQTGWSLPRQRSPRFGSRTFADILAAS